MAVENDLKELILKEYKSIRAFSEYTKIPYSTIDSIFKRGISNSSVANVLKICQALGIDADALGDGRIEKRVTITSAAAHFDPDTLNDEGRAMYNNLVQMLAEKYTKS